eukprot:GILI01002155.1.p2 GENE.GILI01002155.1~~GILI01002155.1.p2  ORF type:complete len:108 (+),score=45.41 GILI01002155.1:66-389(+)
MAGGFEGFVRRYFPEDHKLAIALLSFYGGSLVLYKLANPSPAPPPYVGKAHIARLKKQAATTGDNKYPFPVATLDNANEWFSNKDNVEKWSNWVGSSEFEKYLNESK